MATVSLSPVQQKLRSTPKRRVPLGVVSNAANSPFRGTAAKRPRDQVDAQEDFPWDLQPQAKRQAFDNEQPNRRTSPRKHLINAAEARVFSKRSSNAPVTTFERHLLAVRDEKAQQRVDRGSKSTQQSLKGIKQWQEHYKRAFPLFVFYFEGVPEDVRIRCSKYARSLGAREEKFFSKEVTHVVTTRDIPIDTDQADTTSTVTPSSRSTDPQTPFKPRTINPSLLDQSGEDGKVGSKSRFIFEANKRIAPPGVRDVDPKKSVSGNVDILSKAKEMGMKVWQLEKFQRMIRTMLEVPNDIQTQQGQATKGRPTANVGKGGSREADLSRMLRNERLNGPSDRDATVAPNEIVPFKGPYIYIRDMDERTRPILVRDYHKPAKGELGDWPQFHGVSAGRCPFVPEVFKDEVEDPKARRQEQEPERRKASESRSAPCTRAAVKQGVIQGKGCQQNSAWKEDIPDVPNGTVLPKQSPQKIAADNFCPPPPKINARGQNATHSFLETQYDSGSRLIGGEPAASGLQPSNITSAIRSQMISSTAAAPGAKAGTSKEVHGLQRKVLQKNVPAALVNRPSRETSLDPVSVTRASRAVPLRDTRRQAQRKINHQDEESTQSEDEDVWLAEDVRKSAASKKKSSNDKPAKAICKPGYCENCRDKYEDFDEHIESRKHRKFALSNENWKDLDRLLAQLGRQLKDPDSDSS